MTSPIQPAGRHDGNHDCAVNTLEALVYCGTKIMMLMIHTFMHDQYNPLHIRRGHSAISVSTVAGDCVHYMLILPLFKRSWTLVKSKLHVSFDKQDALAAICWGVNGFASPRPT